MPNLLFLAAVAALSAPADGPAVDPAHSRNTVYQDVLRDGLREGGTVVPLPPPTFRDVLDPAAAKQALRAVCGSDQAAAEFLRDSVTAPQVVKIRDVEAKDAIVRCVDVYFVVRADLAKLDPRAVASEQQSVDVGNMQFEQATPTEADLKARERTPKLDGDDLRWYAQTKGRLLGRIAFQAVQEAASSRGRESLVVAARVDRAFDATGPLPNQWTNLAAKDAPPKPYTGGVSYVKLTRLPEPPGALLVETHAAFAEPRDWFQGAPILRSKISLAVQDQVRRLRRELLKSQPRAADSR